jgi:E3 ubiquitin-protein ligase RNF216
VLEAKVFACLARRLQTEEIRAAMIPDLETCPFCPFSYIPDDNSLVFECQEDTCQKVSCRFVTTTLCCSKTVDLCQKYFSKCKEPNHLPLKCEEVEKDEEIEARRAIEERMTEALIRLVIHLIFQSIDEQI